MLQPLSYYKFGILERLRAEGSEMDFASRPVVDLNFNNNFNPEHLLKLYISLVILKVDITNGESFDAGLHTENYLKLLTIDTKNDAVQAPEQGKSTFDKTFGSPPSSQET